MGFVNNESEQLDSKIREEGRGEGEGEGGVEVENGC